MQKDAAHFRLALVISVIVAMLVVAKFAARYDAVCVPNTGSPPSLICPDVGNQVPAALTEPLGNYSSFREGWMEERDLYAQVSMAQWAYWMVWISAASVLVGAIGIIYLAFTYREAKKATAAANLTIEETKRIGEAQVRAYLAYEKPECIIAKTEIRFGLKVNNVGQSPAKIFGIMDLQCELTVSGPSVRTFKAVDFPGSLAGAEIGQIAGTAEKSFSAQFRFQKEDIDRINRLVQQHDILFWVRGIFWYRDVFGSTITDPFLCSGRFPTSSFRTKMDFLIIQSNSQHVITRAAEIRKEVGQAAN